MPKSKNKQHIIDQTAEFILRENPTGGSPWVRAVAEGGAPSEEEDTLGESPGRFICQKFEGEASGHDWHHINRVWRLTKKSASASPDYNEAIQARDYAKARGGFGTVERCPAIVG